MLNVLVVDDEPGALKAMKYLLNWERFGFAVTGEATSGKMALQMLEQERYDLLITDIRMPGISGLELISRVREKSKLPIVVVSGFEDFTYLKECMKYGVKDYLLKPVIESDAEKLLISIKNDIDQERMLNKKLDMSAPAARDHMLKQWTHGNMKESELSERLPLWGLTVTAFRSYCCLVVEMDFQETMDAFMTEADIKTKRFAVRNVMEELLARRGYLFEESPERYGIVLCEDKESMKETELIELATMLQDNALHYTKTQVAIGIGEPVSGMSDVNLSFRSAKRMLDRKFFLGSQSIISNYTFARRYHPTLETNADDLQSLLEVILQGDKQRAAALLSRQRDRFMACDASKVEVQTMVMDLFAGLIRYMSENVSGQGRITAPSAEDYLRIAEAGTIQKLFEFASHKCMQVIDIIEQSKRANQLPNTVERVKQIVASDYGSNISLKSIAEQVHMSPVYLGQLFKASEDVSFNDYLMGFRMEKAKELLTNTDRKVYTIAYDVGYRQLDWFYKKFKAYTGFSASEYRSLSE
ncbi:response regulator [Paenibacillus sp. LHD-38]|uniref:response regulator n=1 Tax=Paenibacillus sp. LHD-38 TaxID=3072143 RepID=UPI00280F3280|nr:response regulator [Paenibacillus sp. LHD-38]MDQ8738998.1 response regulator [Paenibacillus sp. LHD-38]